MAGISGVSPSNLAALNRILTQIGKGMDPQSPSSQKLDDKEASKVIGELKKLPEGARAEMTGVLQNLLKDRFIDVTDGGRKAFAEAMNVPVAALTPSQTAELAGLQSARSAFAMNMQALAKTPVMRAGQMKEIIGGLKDMVDPESQKPFAAILLNASKEGILKMESGARKELTKWVGALNQDGGVTERAQAFEAKRTDHGVTAFQRALAKGGFFEDILAAFMFDLLQEIQGEVMQKASEFDRKRELDAMDDQKQQDIKESAVKDLIKGETGGKDGVKDADGPQATSPAYTEAQIDEAQKRLEALVQQTTAFKSNDGQIDAGEAVRIKEKLSSLEPPVDKLVADAALKALTHTDLPLDGTIKPVVDWAVEKLTVDGVPPDISKKETARSGDASDPVVRKLAESSRLEDKIASFIIEAFVGTDKMSVGDKVKHLNKCRREWGDAARRAGHVMDGDGPRGPRRGGRRDQDGPAAVDGGGAPPAGGPPAGEPAAGQPAAGTNGDMPLSARDREIKTHSRQELMEELKTLQQELQQALQALSNILNMMHQNSMNSIRSIR